jgi:hypothetical protein
MEPEKLSVRNHFSIIVTTGYDREKFAGFDR